MFKYLFLPFFICVSFFACVSNNGEDHAKSENETIAENDISPEVYFPHPIDISLGLNSITERLSKENYIALETLNRLYLDGDIYDGIDLSLIAIYLPNLESLWVREFDVIDLSFISNLTNLRELVFRSTPEIHNISAISNLENLEELELSSNSIVDLSLVTHLINLKRLTLGYLNTSDISIIRNLENLEYLSIWTSGVESFDFVSDLLNLKTLNISPVTGSRLRNTASFNMAYIEQLRNLEILTIQIYDTEFNPDFSYLENLSNMREIDIVCSNIGDLTPLAMLPNLERLYIFGAYDESIGGSKAINIMTLATSISLKYIMTNFISWESLENFRANEGRVFAERGIRVYSQDLR